MNKFYERPLAEFFRLEINDVLLSSGERPPEEEETDNSYTPVEGGVL